MIYFGVQLLPQACNIVALSEGFARLDQRFFTVEQYDNIEPWSDALKIDPQEPAKWFFDETEFNNPDYPALLFDSLNPANDIYLVNHRKLANVVQFFYEWIAREFDFAPRPEQAFFLASTIRIVDANQIKQFIPDPEPF
jgi:hypothetical protein